MKGYLRFGITVFLVALAIQARLIRSGDLTPTWPAIIAVLIVAILMVFNWSRSRGRANQV